MRTGLMFVAALCAAGWCVPALADTVQTSTSTLGCTDTPCFTTSSSALQPFNGSMGTLTGISLQVTATDTDYFASYPVDYTMPGSIDWSYSGPLAVTVNGKNYTFNISGSGTVPITHFSIGYEFTASGSGTFQIDPSLFSSFIGTADQCDTTPPLVGVCVSRWDAWFGANYSLNNAGTPDPTDDAVSTNYALTYTYNPFAVPELSTWTMMLLGFGAIGVGMKRKLQPKLQVSSIGFVRDKTG